MGLYCLILNFKWKNHECSASSFSSFIIFSHYSYFFHYVNLVEKQKKEIMRESQTQQSPSQRFIPKMPVVAREARAGTNTCKYNLATPFG